MRKNRHFKTAIVLSISVVTFLVFTVANHPQAATSQNFIASLINPVRSYLLKVSDVIADIFSGILNSKNLKEENEKFIFQNQTLKSILSNYLGMKAENDALRQALKIKERQKFDFILADVISRSPLNFSQSFSINKGSEDGVKVGEPVIWAGQVLAGEVREVHKGTSDIRAINDSEFRAAVFVGEKRVEAIFKGNGLEPPQLDLVPINAELMSGDRIITSGLDKKFPRGFYLGEVKSANKLEGKVFQEIEVAPPFQWNNLEQVLIVK